MLGKTLYDMHLQGYEAIAKSIQKKKANKLSVIEPSEENKIQVTKATSTISLEDIDERNERLVGGTKIENLQNLQE